MLKELADKIEELVNGQFGAEIESIEGIDYIKTSDGYTRLRKPNVEPLKINSLSGLVKMIRTSLFETEMISKFTIYGRLDGLNEYTKANRSNKYKGNKTKQDNEFLVSLYIRQAKLKRVEKYPIALKITWYEATRKRDIDNITFATKFIQDALVKCGVLVNDGQKQINRIVHDVQVDKSNPRIEVEIIEVG